MSTALNRPRILVVEDEVIVAMDIAMQLRELGFEPVGHATRGEQAIELAGQLRPDLVLMDVQLASSMDGVTAAQAIRTQFGVPVVFLSAFDSAAAYDRAALTEPAGYITKPFDDYQLRAVVEAALGKN
ncbi:MAG: response regulator [Rhodoferax sp.]|jgi:CheY-like chemotaxis protein|nr:response regulator [Rhodoferax sp.]MBP9683079.1 response regulator [Rhodoferax sp.]